MGGEPVGRYRGRRSGAGVRPRSRVYAYKKVYRSNLALGSQNYKDMLEVIEAREGKLEGNLSDLQLDDFMEGNYKKQIREKHRQIVKWRNIMGRPFVVEMRSMDMKPSHATMTRDHYIKEIERLRHKIIANKFLPLDKVILFSA